MFRRYTCVRQGGESDCGAAALATIALHYRRPIALEHLRDLTGTDRIGANLLGLLQAAESLGFSAKGVKGSYDSIPHIPLPAIAHVKTKEGLGHFVVLYRVHQRGVVVADPACGVQRLSQEEFSQRWSGYLLLVVPNPQASPAGTRNHPISPWRRFLSLLHAHTPVLVEAFCCALFMTILGVSTSYFIQHLVDSVLVRHEAPLLNALGVGMVLILVFRTLFGTLRQYLVAYVGRKVNLLLIAGYARHLLGLPLQFFEMRRAGEILARVNDAAKVGEAIGGTALTALVDVSLVGLLVGVLWLYDGPLALVATAFIVALALSVVAHHPVIRRRAREAMENGAQLAAHLVEDISGVETVKAFRAERMRSEQGEMRLVGFVQSLFSLQKLSLSTNAVGLFGTSMAAVVILWYGGHRVMTGALTVGQLMFFYSLLGYLLEPLERLAAVNLRLQDALIAVDRLYQVMDLEVEPVGQSKKAMFAGVRHAIELQDVSFHYGCRANVLEQVSLRILPGKTVAIIGESGSGKSTLLKLLLGFYAPTAGRILVDGTDLRDVELASWRRAIGLVAQDPFIFNATLGENIALGQPGATLAQVAEVARVAGLEDVVAGLPERYETIIGERGANLSGGQRQRLAIARALLGGPEILIFDEATSHLDTATERAIQDSLKTALTGKTVMVVAHRLSSVMEADLIFVLHRGRVVQAGTHWELLGQEGLYRTLWRAQTGEDKHDLPTQTALASPHQTNGHGPTS
jgi:HlyB family type I secretion system ABC transporter